MLKNALICLPSVVLACIVVLLSQQNARLARLLTTVQSDAENSFQACTLPSTTVSMLGDRVYRLEFPRPRPLLILAASRTCAACQSSMDGWAMLAKRFGVLDRLLYDGGHSYSKADLDRLGIDPAVVVMSSAPPLNRRFANYLRLRRV